MRLLSDEELGISESVRKEIINTLGRSGEYNNDFIKNQELIKNGDIYMIPGATGCIRHGNNINEYQKYTPVSNILSRIGNAIINLANKVEF